MNIKLNKEYRYFFIIITTCIVIGLLPFLFHGFYIKYDFMNQHIPFYKSFYSMIDSLSFQWNWNYFLGQNVYGLKAYYFIGDIFAWISYVPYRLFNSVSKALFLVTVVKFYVGAFGCYQWLKSIKLKNSICLIFSIIFIFSGWSSIFMEQVMFTSFYMWIPYALWGIELYLSKQKSFIFIISCTLLISTQYYLMWPCCWLMLIYYLFRLKQTQPNNHVLHNVKLSLRLFLYFCIALALSCFIWLPSVIALSDNPRTAIDFSKYTSWSINQLLFFVQNLFMPVNAYNNMLYASNQYYFYQLGLYTGVLNLFFIALTFKIKALKMYRILVVLALIILIHPYIGIFFHFTYGLRYTLISTVLLVFVGANSANYLLEKQCIDKPLIKVIQFIGIVMIGLILVLGLVIPLSNNYNITSYPEVGMYSSALLFIIIYLILVSFNKKIKSLLLVGGIEVVTMFLISMNVHTVKDITTYDTLIDEDKYNQLINVVKENDDSFYRIYVDFGNINQNLYLNYPSVTNYDSTFQYTLNDFLLMNRKYPSEDYNFNLNDPLLFDLLNVKYVITKNDNLDYWYYFGSVIYQDDSYAIFNINNTGAMARSYQQFDSLENGLALKDSSKEMHEIISLFYDYAFIDSENVNSYSTKYGSSEHLLLEPIAYSSNTMDFEFSCEDDQFIQFAIPYDKGWKVYDNDKVISSFSSSGGLLSIEVTSGTHDLHLVYEVPSLNIGIIVSSIALIGYSLFVFKTNRLKG